MYAEIIQLLDIDLFNDALSVTGFNVALNEMDRCM
jgi:hypothetical protein